MSKITFRADDDLVRQLDEFDASKSEVMREALREYLEDPGTSDTESNAASGTVDAMLADRVDTLIEERLGGVQRSPQDVNVNITLEGAASAVETGESTASETRKTDAATEENATESEPETCKQCGDELPQSAVYCANCGEKATHRVFCECGDELRSDWAFCPACGRRTTAADVLNDS
ncbi:MAG: zinc ribbon domain-containing protein [Halobacteriales archaeon]|nr:zinc ribbon domain-containing protein [Halobacteriales archaeon]